MKRRNSRGGRYKTCILFVFLSVVLVVEVYVLYRHLFAEPKCWKVARKKDDCILEKNFRKEMKKYAWAISAYSYDYFEQLYVLLNDISERSEIHNVVILTKECNEGENTVLNTYRTFFSKLNIICHEVVTICQEGSRCFGADTKLYLFDLHIYGYKKIVSLDADLTMFSKSDELFCYDTNPSTIYGIDRGSSKDIYPQLINSGVMVIEPSQYMTTKIQEFLKEIEPDTNKMNWILKECEHQKIMSVLFYRRDIQARCFPHTYNLRMGSFYRNFIKENIQIFHFNVKNCKPWADECDQDLDGVPLMAYWYWKHMDKKIRDQIGGK